ncbi:ATP-binding cassette domain-containing protein [Psychrobacillus sp. FSL W7-1457]|uniref:cell division ATP-binding protein FtsE n=1 Tax=Psychrobacillus sp. FSL W7-1457 TaxID=2954547 RepID=UPI003159E9C0
MIRITDVSKRYGDMEVLSNIHFQLMKGEFVFLRGRSGSGKSTLLKLLYREVDVSGGVIEFDGVPINTMKKFELRRKIGIIFQSFELIEQKTVIENVMLAGRVLGLPLHEMESEALRLIERVGLTDKINAFPPELSGGQQQRVAIVRALLNKPLLLLADEPTGNLDNETSDEIMVLLDELHKEENIAILIVTHSDRLLSSVAKCWMMEDGRLYEQASF